MASTPKMIPSHFDAVLYNKPDCKSVLVHSQSSSSKHCGFRAILCFYSQPFVPDHLGLPKLDNYEDIVFLQVAGENQPFIQQSQQAVPHHWMLQINITEYLILLQFVNKEWDRLHSKLNYQLKMMREGSEPIYISNRLVFYNHGSCCFKTHLSARLVLRAWIDSADMDSTVHCCLEKKVDYNDDPETMVLPMESLITLAQDALGMRAMTDILAYYKSRVKK
jgi:hypothetical protein